MSNYSMRTALEIIRDHANDNSLWRTEGHVTVMLRLIYSLCESALDAPSAAPAQPVTNRDDVERAIAFHHSELLANGPLVAMQKTLSAFSAAPAHHIAADTVEDAELPERWLPINDAPWTDDLIWVRKGDSIDGPKRIDHDDYDKYTHYAPCEPPAILAKRGEA